MKYFIPMLCLAGGILQVLLQDGSFFKLLFQGGGEKLVICNLRVLFLN